MAAIRSTDTKPERLLRRALWERGLRGYRCQWREPSGRIDIAFTRWKVAVFVDGCFWHGCPEHGRREHGRNADYWRPKIAMNRERDDRQTRALEAAGWTVLRIWEHENPAEAAARISVMIRPR